KTGMHDVVLRALRDHAGRQRLWTLGKTPQHQHLGTERPLIKIERFLTLPVETQIGLHLHGFLLVWRPPRVWLQGVPWARWAAWARKRSSCACNSGVNSGPKSAASNT